MEENRKSMKDFSYLSPADIEYIETGFKELGIEYQEPYEDALIYPKNLEKVSLYKSDDFVYSVDISADVLKS